jgi:hypothetical protein
MATFGSGAVAVVTGTQEEIMVIRATPPPPKEKEGAAGATHGGKEGSPVPRTEEEQAPTPTEALNLYVLPASTAPGLLQTNSRPKRARGQTSDYKAVHEGKQNRPKRSKEPLSWIQHHVIYQESRLGNSQQRQ